MNHKPDLRILFPTNFSDACFRTIRAVAQLADSCAVDLTIVHAAEKDFVSKTKTQRELDSFYAEADHYECCRRVLLEGDPLAEILKMTKTGNYDLVMLPACDRIGVSAFLHASFRARLMKVCPTPIWTVGQCLDRLEFRRGCKVVTCLVDFDCNDFSHLNLAMSLAGRIGASVRIVHVVEPIHEGTLARVCLSDAPLSPDLAIKKMRSMLSEHPEWPQADIAVVIGTRELPNLVTSCDADLVFVGPGQALGVFPFLPKLQSWLKRLPCPVVCVDGASAGFREWSFQKKAAAPARTPEHLQVSPAQQVAVHH